MTNNGSLNLGAYDYSDGTFDFERLGTVVRQVVPFLDRVIDINYYPTPEAEFSNHKWRPVGLGLMGLQDVLFKKGLAFDSADAKELSRTISAHIYFHALWASTDLAEVNGPHEAYAGTRAAKGDLQFDLWDRSNGGVTPPAELDWDALRGRVAEHGLRNSLLIAIAPTATIASIAGCYECIEPQVSNLFKRETLSGEFMQINRYLVRELQARGLWDEQMIADIKRSEGSVQDVPRIPDELKEIYRTAWEVPQRALIDMAAERGAFIDQSQSLNLFMETPTIGKLSSMYLHAWKAGLKTTYYLRSRPATRINQTTSGSSSGTPTPPAGGPSGGGEPAPEKKTFTDEDAIAFSLENPEASEECDRWNTSTRSPTKPDPSPARASPTSSSPPPRSARTDPPTSTNPASTAALPAKGPSSIRSRTRLSESPLPFAIAATSVCQRSSSSASTCSRCSADICSRTRLSPAVL